jgi:hypothetical protein
MREFPPRTSNVIFQHPPCHILQNDFGYILLWYTAVLVHTGCVLEAEAVLVLVLEAEAVYTGCVLEAEVEDMIPKFVLLNHVGHTQYLTDFLHYKQLLHMDLWGWNYHVDRTQLMYYSHKN